MAQLTDSIVVGANPTTRTYQPSQIGFQPHWIAVLNLSGGTVYAQYYIGQSSQGPNALEWQAGLYYALSLQPTGAGGAVQVIIDGGTAGKQIVVTLSDVPLPANPGNFGVVVISGSVTVTGTVAVSGTVNIGTMPNITINNSSGAPLYVNLTNSVTVSGTVTVTGTVDIGTMPNITINNSSTAPLYVSVTSSVSISGTVTVSGTVNIGTLPDVTVSSVTGTVTVSVSNTITVEISGSGNTIIIGNTTSAPGYIQAASGEFDTQSSFDASSSSITSSPTTVTLISSGDYITYLQLQIAASCNNPDEGITVELQNGGSTFAQFSVTGGTGGASLTVPITPVNLGSRGVSNSGITAVITWGAETLYPGSYSFIGYGILASATPPQKTAVIS